MNKFEAITLLHIENSDYTDGVLNPVVEREIDAADIVIDAGKVVKNRIVKTDIKENQIERDSDLIFDPCIDPGLILDADCFAYNMHILLKAGILLQLSDNSAVSQLGGEILDVARDYSYAAASKYSGNTASR